MLLVTSNAALVAAQLEAGEKQLPAASAAVRNQVAEYTFEKDKQYLQEIYDQSDTEEIVGGDFLGSYTAFPHSFMKRTGALKAAETLLVDKNGATIFTKQGLITGPRGVKRPELYAEDRMEGSRPAGQFWRERAADEGEDYAERNGDDLFVKAMPGGLVTK